MVKGERKNECTAKKKGKGKEKEKKIGGRQSQLASVKKRL